MKRASDKVFLYKAFNIAKSLKYDGYQSDLSSTVYNLFDKKCCGANTSGAAVIHENKSATRSEIYQTSN